MYSILLLLTDSDGCEEGDRAHDGNELQIVHCHRWRTEPQGSSTDLV